MRDLYAGELPRSQQHEIQSKIEEWETIDDVLTKVVPNYRAMTGSERFEEQAEAARRDAATNAHVRQSGRIFVT